MGGITNLYSWIDRMKRRGSDFASDPAGFAEMSLTHMADLEKAKQQRLKASFESGTIDDAAMQDALDVGMNWGLLGMANKASPKDIRVIRDMIQGIDRSLLTKEESVLLDNFGSKFVREKAAAKKASKLQDGEAGSRSLVKGNKEKVDPDVYRKMQDQLGENAVLAAAARGDHLKRMENGSYIGGPRTITSPAGLGAMRNSIDQQFDSGVASIHAADPSRLGTWYDRAKEAQARTNEPYQLPRSLELTGVYSAGVSPEMELMFQLGHRNSRALGNPQFPFRAPPALRHDAAVEAGVPAKLGAKINEYGNYKNNPEVFNGGLFGVNDFRAAQGFGFTDPLGRPWKAGVSDTMHPFMDAETALATKRASDAGVGGRTDWAGPHLQEVPWILGKAQDLYSRGYKARYSPEDAGSVLDGIKKSIIDANGTIADSFPKHTFSATHERVAGNNAGHIREMIDAPWDVRKAYGDAAPWVKELDTMPTVSGNVVGAGPRDVLYSAAGFRQLPAIDSTGAYTNFAGKVETNPMTISRPLVDVKKGASSEVNPQTLAAADFVEHFRGAMDAQEAYAGHLAATNPSASAKNSLLLKTSTDGYGGTQATESQMRDLFDVIKTFKQPVPKKNVDPDQVTKIQFDPMSTNEGVLLRNFSDNPSWRQSDELMKQLGPDIQRVFPSEVVKARVDETNSIYGKAFRPEGNGATTQAVLEHAARVADDGTGWGLDALVKNISESPDVRKTISQMMDRDSQYVTARPDVEMMRKFFSEADWAKAVELIVKKGLSPAAAVSALGYSLPSMAGGQGQQR
jgi:hypothetical protein